MIKVQNLTKHFGDFCALDSLALHVPKGAVYGLVGPNGAGKTTFIRHLTGVYRPDAGEVLIDGETVYENPAVKNRFSYIPDEVFYFHSANLNDMMKFYSGIYGNFDTALYHKLCEAFSLDPKKPIRSFSKGMQKQAAFLLSLSTRPDLLILDEPVDGLDPVMRRQVWSLILQDVAERNATVLVSSHNLRELEDVCDHVGIMHQGKMLLERSRAELQGNIVKVQVAFSDKRPANLEILHSSQNGRLESLIVRGPQEEIRSKIEAVQPLFFDLVPLSLEEVFVYELGGVSYDVKNIIL